MKGLNHYLRVPARYTLWLLSAAGVVLAFGAWLAFLAFAQHRIVDQATTRNNKLQAMQASSKAPATDRAELESQKRWAQLKVERDFPWPAVFKTVETVASPDIELLQFKPDKLNHTIALGGEAKDRKALVTYLSALAAQPALKNVYLIHQQSVQRDRLETVSFEIRAALRE